LFRAPYRSAKDATSPLSDSIVHELRTEHPIAKAYLASHYGSVIKVRDTETLAQTSRGIMKDGRAAGSHTMYTVDPQDLVFGQEARRIKREKVAEDHRRAELQLAALRRRSTDAGSIVQQSSSIVNAKFAGKSDLEQAASVIERTCSAISALDLSEVQSLQTRSNEIRAQIDVLEYRISESNKNSGSYQNQAATQESLRSQLKSGLVGKQQAVKERKSDLATLCSLNPVLSLTVLLDEATEAALRESRPEVLLSEAHSQENAARASYDAAIRKIGEYHLGAQSDERLDVLPAGPGADGTNERYISLVTLRDKISGQLSVQRDIGVVKNLDQLRVAESSFNDVFTKQFCYEIRNAVDSGVRTLVHLNRDLEKLKFGTDRFIIDWREWVPEFKEYYDFFKATCELSEAKESLDLFGESDLSPENKKVRDNLAKLLLAEDQDRALKDLQRIADYRNYRRYDIIKRADSGSEIRLSQWGTGSGGQLETPAYLVRAAVLTNRLKNFDKAMSLRLMMNDESFAKTDERRARDIIQFLRDRLGMQLLCAMPTKHAGAIKTEFTKEYSITRMYVPNNGEVDFRSEADARDLRPDALRELWDLRRAQMREQARIEFERDELKL
jgi:hypothetical protein